MAAVSSKGSLIIIEVKSEKRVNIQGKHSKAITGLGWNSKNELACCSSDKTVIFTLL